LDAGYVYIAQPPLYKIKIGKEVHYVYNEAEMEVFKKKHGLDKSKGERPDAMLRVESAMPKLLKKRKQESENSKNTIKTPRVSIQRYKGLGK